MEREKIKAVEYICGYKSFKKEEGYNWTSAIWDLFNFKNTWSNSSIIKLDVNQFGKDDNGFYENYIDLIVSVDSKVDWDEYLSGLGYGFTKHDITVMKYIVDWDENIDEVVVEVD